MELARDSVAICTIPNLFTKGRMKDDVLKEVLKDFDATDALDQMDLVSIIFLMINEKSNFESVVNLLEKEPANLFLNLKNLDNWAEKFIEALMITGNFKIIRKLGYTESEIQSMKLEFVYDVHNISINLNKVVKSLYFLCKNLRSEKVKQLTAIVNGKLSITMNSPWLELHILRWLKYSYITIDPSKPDLSTLIEDLKQIGALTDFCQSFNFESWGLGPNNQHVSRTDSEIQKNRDPSRFSISNRSDRAELNHNTTHHNTTLWPEDHEKLCIIINEVEFLDKNRYKDRIGSDKDEENLKRTFKGCGFEVEAYKNHGTEEMDLLLNSLRDPELHYHNYGSIVICILSHGFKGEIVLSDNKTVKIEEIEDKLCCENLCKTFKLIILQTCQGKKIGVVDKKLVSDGPTMDKGNPIYHQYFGVFQASIDNFVAFRHEEDGSWFIKEICNVLREETPMVLHEWISSVIQRMAKRVGQLTDDSCKNEYVVQVPCYRGCEYYYPFSKYRVLDDF